MADVKVQQSSGCLPIVTFEKMKHILEEKGSSDDYLCERGVMTATAS